MTSSTSSKSGIAVIIPAYNATRTLRETVASARLSNATRIVVVDDGSTDGTAALATSLGCTVISQQNSGAAAARRAGIRSVEEEYTVLLDSDDSLVPSGIAESLRQFGLQPGCVAVLGSTVGVGHGGARRELRHWDGGVNTTALIERGHAPGPPAAFIWKTSALLTVIGDSPPAVWPRYAEDYEFIVRGSLLGKIAVHSEISCLYQWTGGKSSNSPLQSISDAEAIRVHYAALTGVSVKARTRAEVRSMVWLRKASAHTSSGVNLRRASFVALAVLCNPVGIGRRVLQRLQRKADS